MWRKDRRSQVRQRRSRRAEAAIVNRKLCEQQIPELERILLRCCACLVCRPLLPWLLLSPTHLILSRHSTAALTSHSKPARHTTTPLSRHSLFCSCSAATCDLLPTRRAVAAALRFTFCSHVVSSERVQQRSHSVINEARYCTAPLARPATARPLSHQLRPLGAADADTHRRHVGPAHTRPRYCCD